MLWLILTLLLPLLLAVPLAMAPWWSTGYRLLALMPLSALGLALYDGSAQLQLTWLLLGSQFALDAVNRPFLLLLGILWTLAGLHALHERRNDERATRFWTFWLLSYFGNLGCLLAHDIASFYLSFTVMSLAAYGLINHRGSHDSRRAGTIYLTLAMIGEVLLLAAVLLIASEAGNAPLDGLPEQLAQSENVILLTLLALTGFGIKMGVAPLHIWLPLAHGQAPTPASAVLSGSIIKLGLLGWLRFLPDPSGGQLAAFGTLLVVLGILTALYAATVGCTQKKAKTVLAYSSVSQMGLAALTLGIGLMAPQHWPLITRVLLLFALHHGLAKAALFLGVSISNDGHRWSRWLLLIPALTLAGAPIGSGMLAKQLLKDTATLAPTDTAWWLAMLLPISSLATALLMARFLFLVWPRRDTVAAPWSWTVLPWLATLACSLSVPVWWASQQGLALTPNDKQLIAATTPVLTAALVGWLCWLLWRIDRFTFNVPEGDVLALAQRLPQLNLRNDSPPALIQLQSRPSRLLETGDRVLRRWPVLGLALCLMLLLTLILGNAQTH